MRVRDVMTTLVHTCRPQDSLDTAARLLWEHDCGSLPVVDGNGKVGAMITDRDICMAALLRGRPLHELRVADCMSQGIATCKVDDDLATAGKRMAEHQVHRLPIVDGDGRLAGIVSLNDLVGGAGEHAFDRAADQAALAAFRALRGISAHRDHVPMVTPTASAATTPAVAAGAAAANTAAAAGPNPAAGAPKPAPPKPARP